MTMTRRSRGHLKLVMRVEGRSVNVKGEKELGQRKHDQASFSIDNLHTMTGH